jgi:hypothetical protein
MSAPKKPPEPPAALNAQPLELTSAEKILLQAYRATDDEGRDFIAMTALSQSRRWSRHASPSLRLVIGCAA